MNSYLTKLADQVVALISDEHADKLVWKESISADADASSDEEESDRLFTFQVSKTVAQEESVMARPGFHVGLLVAHNRLSKDAHERRRCQYRPV